LICLIVENHTMSNRRSFLKKAASGSLLMLGGDKIGAYLTGQDESKRIRPSEIKFLSPDDIRHKYNIIWITCDEMNTKAMSVYGNQFTKMPAAEIMAAEGVCFAQPYVQMPKSVPSRCSMITGRCPHCEGHRTLKGKKEYIPNHDVSKNWDFTLTEGEPNLVKFLKERGYKTCLLGKNHLVDWNLHKVWFDSTSQWDSEAWKNMKNPYTDDVSEELKRAYFRGKIKEDFDYDQLPDGLCVKWSKEFLRENKNEPFFALIDIGIPHPPYAEYTQMPSYSIPLENIPLPKSQAVDRVPSVERAKRLTFDLESLSELDRKRMRRAYLTMCEYADSCVKSILEEVDNLGLAEKTLIIYSADHGDSFAERNLYEKWDTCFYEEIVKVPLLMRLPGFVPASKRIENLVEFVDIVPTIMEMLGAPVPPWVQGKSMLPLILGRTEEHKDAVFSQGGVEKEAWLQPAPYRDERGNISTKQKVVWDFPESMARSKMIRMGDYKYIYRLQGDHELYNLRNDPGELVNLVKKKQYTSILSDLKERMLQFTIESETNYPLIDQLEC
jgi:arylsulfatase A-like enzyme